MQVESAGRHASRFPSMRKTVFIPVIPMAPVSGGQILELLIEPGPLGTRSPDLSALETHGLKVAVSAAQSALTVFSLKSPAAMHQHRFLASTHQLRQAVFFVRNPIPEISNAAGAALGIALGILMYDRRCPCQQLIATGRFSNTGRGSKTTLLAPIRLEDQLKAALCLGRQENMLPFFVPARLASGESTLHACQSVITELDALNIPVIPVEALEEAVARCQQLSTAGSR